MKLFFAFLGSLLMLAALAQQDTPHDINPYGMIDTSKNRIQVYGSQQKLDRIFSQLNNLAVYGIGRVNILHIGDSHIQADYFSGQMRKHFSTMILGGEASRGFVFPYTVAKTNNPSNYRVGYSGAWQICKNLERGKNCHLGLSGMSATTQTPNARVTITQPGGEYGVYLFDKIKVFHKVDPSSFSIRVITDAKITQYHSDADAGYTEFTLDRSLDTLKLEFAQLLPSQTFFELDGISLETTDNGITYSATGVNGADVPAWLRCPQLGAQVKSLNCDIIIVSLGTNDGYNTHFNEDLFYENMDSLLSRLKTAEPNAILLLTTPGDSYRYKTQLNRNTEKTQRVLTKLAQKHACLLWDFYDIMGGQNSMLLWQRKGLSGADRLHYSKEGYLLQGDMLFSAFIKLYDSYMQKTAKYTIPDTQPINNVQLQSKRR